MEDIQLQNYPSLVPLVAKEDLENACKVELKNIMLHFKIDKKVDEELGPFVCSFMVYLVL
jgi:hypothetical protein